MSKKLTPDEEHELYEKISEQVHKLVNAMTKNVHKENDYEIRQRLVEQFRFWR